MRFKVLERDGTTSPSQPRMASSSSRRRALLRGAPVLCAAVLALAASCREKSEAIDNITDCYDVCNRYADCFDPGFPTDACIDHCYDRADESLDYEFKVDKCASCMTDKTCPLIEEDCLEDCDVIVVGGPVAS